MVNELAIQFRINRKRRHTHDPYYTMNHMNYSTPFNKIGLHIYNEEITNLTLLKIGSKLDAIKRIIIYTSLLSC